MKRVKRRPSLVEGVDYYCGTCAGHHVVPCPYCAEGTTVEGPCTECRESPGKMLCPQCLGGTVAVRPPDWL